MKTIKVEHLYALPPLYDLLYNTNEGYKLGEVIGFARMLEDYSPTHVLELFAGYKSYHRRAFMEKYYYAEDITAYKTLDAYSNPHEHVIVGDPSKVDYGMKFDAVLAYFRSGGCAFDPDHPEKHITRDYSVRLYANVFKHLNSGGVLAIDYAPDGYRQAIETATQVKQDLYEIEVTVQRGDPLRSYLNDQGIKITDSDEVTLSAAYHCAYDRISGNMVDTMKSCYVSVNQLRTVTFKVALPLRQRLFGEPEMVDILREAGFTTFRFFHMNYTEQDYNELTPSVDVNTDLDENYPDKLMSIIPNVIVAQKD